MGNFMKKITFLSVITLLAIAFGNLSATPQGPILYFNKSPLLLGSPNLAEGHLLCSLESVDLRKCLDRLHKVYQDNSYSAAQRQAIGNEIGQEIENRKKSLWNKATTIATSIAKRLGASTVAAYEQFEDYDADSHDVDFFYIDPAYDITKEVIAMLNKEYNAKKIK